MSKSQTLCCDPAQFSQIRNTYRSVFIVCKHSRIIIWLTFGWMDGWMGVWSMGVMMMVPRVFYSFHFSSHESLFTKISALFIHLKICILFSPSIRYTSYTVFSSLVVSQPSIHFLLKQRPICYVKFAATQTFYIQRSSLSSVQIHIFIKDTQRPTQHLFLFKN